MIPLDKVRPRLTVDEKLFQLLKGQARPASLNLRVHGMHHAPDNHLIYRMETRDGRYVGKTNPTKHRAKKGDILTVAANDFATDESGDYAWINPNVVSHYSDSAHSWKELQALAGGAIVKDTAPGPAGDLPPANDMGASSALPSEQTMEALGNAADGGDLPVGPTLSSVHVNRPLKDISVGYMGRTKKLRVSKADKVKQLVYGVVLEPNTLDSQDDYMLPNQVEKAAHTYLKKAVRGKSSVSKLQHRKAGFFKNKPSVVPVESFIAPVDFTYDGKEMIKKGTWVLVLHIEDKEVWQDVLAGKYTGLSIGGSGIRQSYHVPVPADMMGHLEPEDWAASVNAKFDTPGLTVEKEASLFAEYMIWRDHQWEGS